MQRQFLEGWIGVIQKKITDSKLDKDSGLGRTLEQVSNVLIGIQNVPDFKKKEEYQPLIAYCNALIGKANQILDLEAFNIIITLRNQAYEMSTLAEIKSACDSYKEGLLQQLEPRGSIQSGHGSIRYQPGPEDKREAQLGRQLKAVIGIETILTDTKLTAKRKIERCETALGRLKSSRSSNVEAGEQSFFQTIKVAIDNFYKLIKRKFGSEKKDSKEEKKEQKEEQSQTQRPGGPGGKR